MLVGLCQWIHPASGHRCVLNLVLLNIHAVFTPQPLRAVGVLFSPMVSGWAVGRAGGRQEKVSPGCISETIRCRKLILGRDIGKDV